MLKKIELESERELMSLIKSSPESVERGLKVLTDGFPAERGAIDLLCVDSGKILTIAELKIWEDDSMLLQALRYYDIIVQNVYGIAKLYPKAEVDEKEEPRVILIAPSFSETLKKVTKYLDIALDLIEYDAVEVNGKKEIICRLIDIGAPPKPSIQRSIEDHLSYITDEKVREVCRTIIDKIKNIGEGIEVYARKFYIGFKYKERLFARIYATKTCFYTMATLAPEWEIDKTKIETLSDFSEEHFGKIKETYKEVGGKLIEKANIGSET